MIALTLRSPAVVLATLLTVLASLGPAHAAVPPARPVILQAAMSDPTHFTAVAAGAGAAMPGVLRVDGRVLTLSHGTLGRSGDAAYRFDLAARRVPRFTGPARFQFCLRSVCRSGAIPLPVAVIHGVLGDLAGLLGAGDPYPPLLAALRSVGYTDTGPYSTLAYIDYPSSAALLDLLAPNNPLVPALYGDGVAAFASRYLAPGVRALLAGSYAAHVDLVGHSMGGLIARAYVAEPGMASTVRSIILLGTPNQGSAATFEALGPRTELPATARDLLPTYPYLKDAETGRFHRPPVANAYLPVLNREKLPAGVRFVCIYGRATATDSVLLVHGSDDVVVGAVKVPGDGTVTAASALLPGARAIPLDDGVRHTDLPRDRRAQALIVGLLAGHPTG